MKKKVAIFFANIICIWKYSLESKTVFYYISETCLPYEIEENNWYECEMKCIKTYTHEFSINQFTHVYIGWIV